MISKPLSKASLILIVAVIVTIGYFDHQVGFGFHLFPLYLVPLAIVAWSEKLCTTLSVSLFAGAIVVLKVFLTREMYTNDIYWYWDALVKFSLLQIMSYGLWKIRYLSLAQQQLSDAKIRELNASLKLQVEQLTATNRELEAFSYTISHDLRAPIRHIVGFIDMLNSRDLSSLDDKSRHYLQVITEAARKMGMLIDALLAYSQLGRTELKKSKVDLNRLVLELVQKFEHETKGREIRWDIAPLPDLYGDPAMLRQMMVSLMGNAVKFTRPRAEAKIEVGSVEEGGETFIYVRDNGVGFESRYVHKLFGMFQRLHTTDEFEGIGAGLAVVHRIVQRHGGRAWAEGAVDSGATFWFTIPKAPENSA